MPPPWLASEPLREVLELETIHYQDTFAPPPQAPPAPPPVLIDAVGRPFIASAPFLPTSTTSAASAALPYHWFELAELILDAAPDDLTDPDEVRGLLRDLREVRLAKMRRGIEAVSGEHGVRLDHVGAMEVAESRGLISGLMNGLRKIGASREQATREREEEERENRQFDDDEEDEDMM